MRAFVAGKGSVEVLGSKVNGVCFKGERTKENYVHRDTGVV